MKRREIVWSAAIVALAATAPAVANKRFKPITIALDAPFEREGMEPEGQIHGVTGVLSREATSQDLGRALVLTVNGTSFPGYLGAFFSKNPDHVDIIFDKAQAPETSLTFCSVKGEVRFA